MKTENDIAETRIHWASENDRTAFWEVRRELLTHPTRERCQKLGLALLGVIERCQAGESTQWFPRAEG